MLPLCYHTHMYTCKSTGAHTYTKEKSFSQAKDLEGFTMAILFFPTLPRATLEEKARVKGETRETKRIWRIKM